MIVKMVRGIYYLRGMGHYYLQRGRREPWFSNQNVDFYVRLNENCMIHGPLGPPFILPLALLWQTLSRKICNHRIIRYIRAQEIG
jgi:hypothetical protein